MKKTAVLLLVFFTVFSQILCADVSAKDYGWKITYNGDLNTNRNEFYAEFADEGNVFAGEQALHAKYPADRTNGIYAQVRSDIEIMPDGNYMVEFHYKGGRLSAATDKITINISGQEYIPGDFEREEAVSDTGDAWYKYSMSLENYTACDENYIAFQFNGPINDEMAIDNVSIKDEEGNEMLFDGGFEYANESVSSSNDVYNTSKYQAKDFLTSYGGLALSWKNPSSSELNMISVYEITDAEEVLLTNDLPTTPEEVVFYRPENLQGGKIYNYKIVFSFDTKEDYVYYVSQTHGSGTETVKNYGSAWGVQMYYYEGGIGPMEVRIDDTEKYSGNQSLKMVSNINRDYIELKENCYIRPYQFPELEPKTKYRMSAMIKTEALTGNGFCMRAGWGGANRSFTTHSTDWTLHQFEFETGADPSENENVQITLNAPCSAVWVDDWMIYEIDSEGNQIGENLLQDSSFEEYELSYETGSIDNLTVNEIAEESARLDWESNGDNARINIYQKVFDEFEYRGFMNVNVTSMVLTNLVPGKEYTYMLVPQNADGIEGEGKEVTFETMSVPYIIGDTKLYKDDQEVSEVSDSGEYKIITTVQNLEYTEGMPYTQLVALYRDNVLVSLTEKSEVIKKTDKDVAPKRVISKIDVPYEEGNYTVEVFTFDSLADRNILRECKLFN